MVKKLSPGTNEQDVAIAYLSLAVPDTPRFRNRAAHNNGLTYMRQMLYGLVKSFRNVTAFSAIPMESFQRGGCIWVDPEKVKLENGTIVNCVPFLNITPLKQGFIGSGIFLSIIAWAWRNRKVKNRVVFSFNITVPPILFTAIAGWLVGAKVIAYVCDVIIPGHTQPNTLWYKLDNLIQARMIKYLDGLIVITDAIAEDFGSSQPFLRIEGGISPELIEKTGQYLAEAKPDSKIFTIVASGSLFEYNGINLILQAFQLLQGDQYRLRIAGRGPLETAVQKAAKTDFRIDFQGFVNYDDLLRIHASGDVLLNIRLTQRLRTDYAFPSKTLEYLLSGIPVISTRTGHLEAEFGRYCHLIEEETPETLAKMIRLIEGFSREERIASGLSAREFMIEHKSWDKQCEKICEYISQHLLKS